MCRGRVDFAAINGEFGIDMAEHFAPQLERLKSFEADGLVRVGEGSIEVTEPGWYVVRALAMVFDRYVGSSGAPPRERFSRIV